MPYNLASGGRTNVKRVGLGSGRLFANVFNSASAATPTTDVGYGRGGQLQVTRQKVELILGVPRTLVAQYAIQEDVTLSFNAVQWDPFVLTYAMGAGVTSGTDAAGVYKFGGDMAFAECSVMFTHNLPAGGTVSVDVWKAQGMGELTLSFGDDIHELPYQFKALTAASEWGGATVDAKGSLFRIRIDVPA